MSHLSEITEQLLRRACIVPGMRVLDIGCGSGEVTRAIADLVGLSGSVVGVDGSAVALSAANAATDLVKYKNISYQQCDLNSLAPHLGLFDAVVGRRVLMYVPQPASVVTKLLSMLKPGGTIALQEHDTTITPGRTGNWPVHDQAHAWLWEAVRREGADPQFGFSLAPMLAASGAHVQTVWGHAIFSGFEAGFHHHLHDLVAMMQPRLHASGVATEAQIDLPTLENRLSAERAANNSSYAVDMAVCVIGHSPPAN
jgi:ubiquinone/menaquinone biosynthesis C-methylase UbiE